jgi:hypothetical protein
MEEEKRIKKMTVEYKVPRLLWENLESVLLAQSKRYITELAKCLGVPEKELQKKVLPASDSLKIMMYDTQSDTNQCTAYIQQDKLTIYCRKPTAYQSEYCPFHRHKRMQVISETQPIIIQKVKDRHTYDSLYTYNNILINSSGNMVGKINKKTGTVKMFVIEE